jgi:hypothetical protein
LINDSVCSFDNIAGKYDSKILFFWFSITISSDYDLNGCAYILVKGGSIVNKKAIKNEISSGIIIYPSVTFNKNNPPSEIYLVDPNPRADTKQWLIYKS